jgi:hypothetical protein
MWIFIVTMLLKLKINANPSASMLTGLSMVQSYASSKLTTEATALHNHT